MNISNSIGKPIIYGGVNIGGQPDDPSLNNLVITSYGENSFDISFNYTNIFKVNIHTEGNVINDISKNAFFQFPVTVPNLNPGRSYNLSIDSYNKKIFNNKTLPVTTTYPNQIYTLSKIDTITPTLTGTSVTMGLSGSDLSYIVITRTPVADISFNRVNLLTSGSFNSVSNVLNGNAIITDLSAGTQYSFGVIPYNSSGFPGVSKPLNTATLSVINGATYVTSTTTTVDISLNASDLGNVQITPTGKLPQTFTKADIISRGGFSSILNELKGNITITGLSAGTSYALYMYPYNSLGAIGALTRKVVTTGGSDSSLLFYYKFNSGDINGSNMLANYASGTAVYDATVVGGATIDTTVKQFGSGSLNLSAKTKWVTLPSFTTDTNGFSISLWVKGTSLGTILQLTTDSDNDLIGVNHNALFIFNQTAANNYTTTTYTTNDNNWNHLVFTAQYTTTTSNVLYGNWKMYKNNVNVSSYSNKYYPRNITRSTNYLGKNYTDSAQNSIANFDEFRLYNKVLTAAEISDLYNTNPEPLSTSTPLPLLVEKSIKSVTTTTIVTTLLTSDLSYVTIQPNSDVVQTFNRSTLIASGNYDTNAGIITANATVNQLLPGTNYTLSIIPYNSPVLSNTTQTINTTTLSAINNSSFISSGTTTLDISLNTSDLNYVSVTPIVAGVAGLEQVFTKAQIGTVTNNVLNGNVRVTGLTVGIPYTFNIYPYNSNNVQGGLTTIRANISDISAVNYNSALTTSIDFSMNVSDLSYVRVTATGLTDQTFSKQSIIDNGILLPSGTYPLTGNVRVTNLVAGNTYTLKFYPYSVDNIEGPFKSLTSYTLSRINSVGIKAVTDTSVDISLNATDLSYVTVTSTGFVGVKTFYRTSITTPPGSFLNNVVIGNVFIPNLSSGTRYDFSLCAFNMNEKPSVVTGTSVFTLSKITNASFKSTTTTSIDISLNTSDLNYVIITPSGTNYSGGDKQFLKAQIGTVTNNELIGYVTITGLTPDTLYSFSIIPYNNNNLPGTPYTLSSQRTNATFTLPSSVEVLYDYNWTNLNYTGPIFKLRGNGDSTGASATNFYTSKTGDIVSTGPNATGTLFSNWLTNLGVGNTYARVVTWYDQSSKGKDLSQNTISYQPRLDTTNKSVKLERNTYLLLGVNVFTGTYPLNPTYTNVVRINNVTDMAGAYWCIQLGSGTVGAYADFTFSGANNTAYEFGAGRGSITGVGTIGNNNVLSLGFNSETKTLQMYKNNQGSSLTTPTTSATALNYYLNLNTSGIYLAGNSSSNLSVAGLSFLSSVNLTDMSFIQSII